MQKNIRYTSPIEILNGYFGFESFKEHQEAIFEKYVQFDKKSDGRIYTTGLGLA